MKHKKVSGVTAKVDAKLKDKALDIIQNKLHMSVKDYIEMVLKELVKNHEVKK